MMKGIASVIPSLRPEWPDAPDTVGALSTLRAGGISGAPYDSFNLALHVGDDPVLVLQNRALLRKQLPAEPAWLTQVHGNLVVDAALVHEAPAADASFTNQAGVVCAIMTADCMAVLLRDKRGSVVGAAHAGWRGLASGVLENTVQAMRHAGADEVLAWLGPAIGPQQFEVGEDVRSAFTHLGPQAEQAFLPILGLPGKYLADLAQLARLALARAGVTQVMGGELCTVSDPQRFYSFRRDQVTGRLASLIWIK
jgi:YfiH family protein